MGDKGDAKSADRRGIYADEERTHGKRDGFEVLNPDWTLNSPGEL